MLKSLTKGIGACFVILAAFGAWTYYDAGGFKTITNHYDGVCVAVTGTKGGEDITYDSTNGYAYISAHDRRNWAKGEIGAIYRYIPGSFKAPQRLTLDTDMTFRPHGISLWKNPIKDGLDRLFVINHPENEDFSGVMNMQSSEVLIFDIQDNTLNLIAQIPSPTSLNDITADGPDTYFASIDQHNDSPLGAALELYLQLPYAGVAYGNVRGMKKVLGGLQYANGILLSPERDALYVAEINGQRITKFTRDVKTNALRWAEAYDIDSAPDNIEWGTDGALYTGAHPQLLKTAAHMKDAAYSAPSQVLRIDVNALNPTVTEIYASTGKPMSASTVASYAGGRLLIGSIFEDVFMDCGPNE